MVRASARLQITVVITSLSMLFGAAGIAFVFIGITTENPSLSVAGYGLVFMAFFVFLIGTLTSRSYRGRW